MQDYVSVFSLDAGCRRKCAKGTRIKVTFLHLFKNFIRILYLSDFFPEKL